MIAVLATLAFAASGLLLWRSVDNVRVYVAASAALLVAAWIALLAQDELRAQADPLAAPIWAEAYVMVGVQAMAVTCSSFTLGLSLVAFHAHAKSPPDLRQPSAPRAPERYAGIGVLLGYGIAGAWVAVRGISEVFSRDVYIPISKVAFVGPITNALLPVAFVLAIFAVLSKRRSGLPLATLTTVLVFSSGSRTLAILPILYLVARMGSGKQRKTAPVFVAAGLSWLGLAASIKLRELPTHGLFPYLEGLNWSLLRDGSLAAFGNLVFAVPLAGWVKENGKVERSDLLTAVNPAPSGFTDWADSSRGLRYHPYIPYNGIGELAAQSWITLAVFFVLFGALCAWVAQFSKSLSGATGVVLLAFPVFPAALLLQYNLRSGVRLLYLFVAVATFASSRLSRKNRRRKNDVAQL